MVPYWGSRRIIVPGPKIIHPWRVAVSDRKTEVGVGNIACEVS